MGSVYDGLPGNIAYPTTLNILSSTNTSPISVTTSAPHNLLTGDVVSIRHHAANTNANGANRTITRTGASSFTINGSTGIGVGGATGTVQAVTYGASTTLPSDGDSRNAASVNVPLITALDRTSSLAVATGASKLASRIVLTFAGVGGGGSLTAWAGVSVTAVANTWYAIANAGATVLTDLGLLTAGGMTVLNAQPAFQFDGLSPGDAVRLTLQTDCVQGAATPVRFALFITTTVTGASAPAFGAYSQLPGASHYSLGTGGSGVAPVTFDGWTTTGSSGTLWVQPAVNSLANTGGVTWNLSGDAMLAVEVWRPTGVPQ